MSIRATRKIKFATGALAADTSGRTGDMAGNCTTEWFQFTRLYNSVMLRFSGAPVGTLTIQCRQSPEDAVETLPSGAFSAAIPAVSAAGQTLVFINPLYASAKEYRVNYARTSGTGSLTVSPSSLES